MTLSERIETAFDEAITHRRAMLEARHEVSNKEANAKLEHSDEWAGAKNNGLSARTPGRHIVRRRQGEAR